MYATEVGASGLPVALRRFVPFDQEPGFHDLSGLWLYGNWRLLYGSLAAVAKTFGAARHSPEDLRRIDAEAKDLILQSRTIVCGVHNAAHRRVAITALHFAAPRILVLSGGFLYHLGPELNREPFPAARLWRQRWDASCDLAISRRAPDRLPTYARHNRSIDRLIDRLAANQWHGLPDRNDRYCPEMSIPM